MRLVEFRFGWLVHSSVEHPGTSPTGKRVHRATPVEWFELPDGANPPKFFADRGRRDGYAPLLRGEHLFDTREEAEAKAEELNRDEVVKRPLTRKGSP